MSFCCIMLPLSIVYIMTCTACVRLCLLVYFVSRLHWTFPDVDPGVPYTVTVRARTMVGIGEPVSIVVFSVQQGKTDCRPCVYKEL